MRMKTRSIVVLMVLLAILGLAWRWTRFREPTKSRQPQPTAGQPQAVTLGDRAVPSTLVRALIGPHRIEGIVLMPDGTGAAGAAITIAGAEMRRLDAESDGSFAVDGLLAVVYRVEARHENMIGGPVWVRGTSTVEPVVIRLRPSGGIDVHVSDEYGVAFSGALVDVPGAAPVTTDASGHAHVSGLSADTHAVRVSANARATVVREVDVGTGGMAHVAVTLVPVAPLAGTVVDDRGAPIAGARVTASPVGDMAMLVVHHLSSATTGADGSWKLNGIGPGTIVLVANDETRSSTPLHVTVPASGKHDVRLALDAARTLRGVVRGPDGRPASGSLVRVGTALQSGGIDGEHRQVMAGNDGTFTVSGLPAVEITLVASLDEAVSAPVTVDLNTRTDADVEVVLAAPLRIEGRVVGSDGAPVAEAQVSAEPASPGDEREALLRGPIADLTDGNGRFRLVGLRAGPYVLRAAPPGASPSDGSFHRRSAKSVDAGAVNVELVLPGDGRIVGRVVAQDGGPLARVEVLLDEDRVEGVTDGAGQFAVEFVAPGEHVVEVHADGRVAAIRPKVRVDAGATVDLGAISLGTGAIVRGTVSDHQGRRLGGARVVVADRIFASVAGSGVLDRVTHARSVQSNAWGEFVVRGVPSQARALTATHPTVGTSGPYRLRAGADEQVVDVVITPAGVLHGRVTSAGAAVAGATVVAMLGGGAQVASTQTSSRGEYRFDQLSAGTYAVTATGINGILAAGSVAVSVGGEAQLDLARVRGDLSLDLHVPNAPEGGAVVVARIATDAAGKTSLGQVTIAEPVDASHFLARDVEPGAVKICFVGPDRKRTCRRHELPATPSRQSIEIALETTP